MYDAEIEKIAHVSMINLFFHTARIGMYNTTKKALESILNYLNHELRLYFTVVPSTIRPKISKNVVLVV